jgi:hypothetical protein
MYRGVTLQMYRHFLRPEDECPRFRSEDDGLRPLGSVHAPVSCAGRGSFALLSRKGPSWPVFWPLYRKCDTHRLPVLQVSNWWHGTSSILNAHFFITLGVFHSRLISKVIFILYILFLYSYYLVNLHFITDKPFSIMNIHSISHFIISSLYSFYDVFTILWFFLWCDSF